MLTRRTNHHEVVLPMSLIRKRCRWSCIWPAVASLIAGCAPAVAAGSDGVYAESHALIIAASRYTGGWPDLPGVAGDTEIVREALNSQGFDCEVVADPDRQTLTSAIEGFIHRKCLNPENRIVVYYLGHGHTLRQSWNGTMGYIVPAESPPPGDEAAFRASAVPLQRFENYAREMQAKHALFVFDSCFSGEIFTQMRGRSEYIADRARYPVRLFITAGSADEPVPDHSEFTRSFALGVQGDADRNQDGYVSGNELCDYLKERVTNYSRNTQHPQSGTIRDPNLDRGDILFQVRGSERVAMPTATGAVEVARAETLQDPVIAVMPFYGVLERTAEDGLVLQQLIEREIYDRTLGEGGLAVARTGANQQVRSHAQAVSMARSLAAALVVWGEVIELGGTLQVRPFLTDLMAGEPKTIELSREGDRAPDTAAGFRRSTEVTDRVLRIVADHLDSVPHEGSSYRKRWGLAALTTESGPTPEINPAEVACGPEAFATRDGCASCFEHRAQLCREALQLAFRNSAWARALAEAMARAQRVLPPLPPDSPGCELLRKSGGQCDHLIVECGDIRDFARAWR